MNSTQNVWKKFLPVQITIKYLENVFVKLMFLASRNHMCSRQCHFWARFLTTSLNGIVRFVSIDVCAATAVISCRPVMHACQDQVWMFALCHQPWQAASREMNTIYYGRPERTVERSLLPSGEKPVVWREACCPCSISCGLEAANTR